ALARTADQCLPGLHDRHRVLEGVQVQVEVPPVRAALHPQLDLVRVLRREAVVADLPREVYHGGRPQATVKMIMQQHLGCGPDLADSQWHGPIVTPRRASSTRPGVDAGPGPWQAPRPGRSAAL